MPRPSGRDLALQPTAARGPSRTRLKSIALSQLQGHRFLRVRPSPGIASNEDCFDQWSASALVDQVSGQSSECRKLRPIATGDYTLLSTLKLRAHLLAG